MIKDINFVEEYHKILLNPKKNKSLDWDGFYAKLKIPKKQRSDFLTACILKQHDEKYPEEVEK